MVDDSADELSRRGITRRAVLLSAAAAGLTAAGIATVGATAGATSGNVTADPALRNAQDTASPTVRPANVTSRAPVGVTKIERVTSAARRRKIDFVTVLPDGAPRPGLPMCLLLHGLASNARAMSSGLDSMLAAAVETNATPAFGYVAVDGGDSYWHANRPGDDPMAMLLEEVPRWLAARGLGGPGGTPFAVSGFSMGGFGSLLYARRRAERRMPVNAVGVVSPALITSWAEMSKRNAFHSAADWASMDPLKNLDKLGDAPIGLWDGNQDRFVEGCRAFIAQAHPAIGSISPGQHTSAFLNKVTPEVIRFLGRHVPGGLRNPNGTPHGPAN